jgi:hypothetical protein
MQLNLNQRTGFYEEKTPLGQAFVAMDERLARLHRIIAATKRSFKDALRELERLQSARGEAEAQPIPDYPISRSAAEQPSAQPSAPLTPIGFVPSMQKTREARTNPWLPAPGPRPREASANPQSLAPNPQPRALGYNSSLPILGVL